MLSPEDNNLAYAIKCVLSVSMSAKETENDALEPIDDILEYLLGQIPDADAKVTYKEIASYLDGEDPLAPSTRVRLFRVLTRRIVSLLDECAQLRAAAARGATSS